MSEIEKEEKIKEFQRLILAYWNPDAVPYYFAQVLSGKYSIKETIEDLKSFEKEKE